MRPSPLLPRPPRGLSPRLALLPVLLLLLSLPACGRPGTDEVLEDIRAGLSGSLAFDASIRADYGDRVFDFSVRCASSGDGGTLTITAPEIIAGAVVRYSGGATTLAVGDVEIYTGEILPGGLSPVDAVPVMLDAWVNGLVTETVRETLDGADCVAALFRVDDDVDLRTWFDQETFLPLRAEFTFEGSAVITAEFYDMEVG